MILTNPEAVIPGPMFTSPALAIVREVSGVPPTAPMKSMVPAPAVRPRVCAPLSVLPKEMSSPASNPVVMVKSLVKVTPVAKAIPSLVLAMFPPMLLNPAPS